MVAMGGRQLLWLVGASLIPARLLDGELQQEDTGLGGGRGAAVSAATSLLFVG